MSYIIILVIFLTCAWLINKLFKNTNYYKNKFIDTDKFKNIPKNLEIINLGSNQPKFAFDYTGLHVKGMNWAVGPQTLEYDFRILKNFHNHLQYNSKVLIAISPFQFLILNYKDDDINHKYYNCLDSSLIDNYSNITKRLHIDYPIFTAKKQILRILKDVKPDNRLELNSNPMNDNEIKNDALKWVDGWKKQFQISDLDNIILSDTNRVCIEKNVEILKEMIDFCLERKYEPILIIIPVTKALSSYFPNKFVEEQIINYILQSNQKNVRFLNYWKDKQFEAKEFYFNSFFMNKIGRKRFTKQVLKDLGL